MEKKEMLRLRLDGHTYQYIADKADISRQRIQQILSPPPDVRKYVVEKYSGFCDGCGIFVGTTGHVHHDRSNGEEDYNDTENLRLLCISCHRHEHSPPPQLRCKFCDKAIRNGLFCGRDCREQYRSQRYEEKIQAKIQAKVQAKINRQSTPRARVSMTRARVKIPRERISPRERDTEIIAVRIKKDLLHQVTEGIAKRKVSRNSFFIRGIKELLRPHRRKE